MAGHLTTSCPLGERLPHSRKRWTFESQSPGLVMFAVLVTNHQEPQHSQCEPSPVPGSLNATPTPPSAILLTR